MREAWERGYLCIIREKQLNIFYWATNSFGKLRDVIKCVLDPIKRTKTDFIFPLLLSFAKGPNSHNWSTNKLLAGSTTSPPPLLLKSPLVYLSLAVVCWLWSESTKVGQWYAMTSLLISIPHWFPRHTRRITSEGVVVPFNRVCNHLGRRHADRLMLWSE